MNTVTHSFIVVVCVASVVGCTNLCSAKDKEPTDMLGKKVSQLERLWESGKPQDYYAEARSVAKDIAASSTNGDKNGVATRLLESLLSKTSKSTKTSTDDLFAMKTLVSFLLSNVNSSIDGRRTSIQVISRFLGEIRKETVPNYERKPATENVAPPPGIQGGAIVGMNPEAIRDPVARAKYEAAIQENQDNNLVNTRQIVLQGVEREMAQPIIDYMIAVFQAPDTPQALVDECIKNAKLTAEERKKTESAIGTTGKKSDK